MTTKYNNNNKQTINNQSVKETNRGQIRGREEEGFGGWEDHHHHHQEEGLGGEGTTKYNNNSKKKNRRGPEEEGFSGWEDILDPGKGNQLEEGRTRQYTLEMVERIVYCICCLCILL